ncbi:ABC transporter permease [Longirhabdus pacifica]|uniref:ABC transporter permease n=1 Tax=Longirhabdus pacifica TaxID=2305227 RepID=UPI00100918A3|nr:ABC transporter permease [Longirhabdus pacifica]
MNKIFAKQSIVVPIVSIFLGLMFGAIVMLAGGYNPITAYNALVSEIFSSRYNIGETIANITPLILTGLAVAFAFRTGLFNIGVEGQLIVGMTAATIVGIEFGYLPWFVHMPLSVIAAALAGGLWGGLAGYLKASRGVNEVITTIMLNFIALYLGNYLIKAFYLEPGTARSYKIEDSASLRTDWMTNLFDGARVDLGLIIALIAVIAFYIILWKTKQGFELRAVGLNHHAAKNAGINVNSNVVKAMFISGMLAGLAGATRSLGLFDAQTIAAAYTGLGFDGIAVALLGGNGAIGIVLAATLFGSLKFGGGGMNYVEGVPNEIINVVIASVIFFVAANGIFKLIIKPFKAKRKQKGAAS